MEMNSFKQLENEIISNRQPQLNRIQNNLVSTRSLFQTIGDMLELFIPRVMEVFIKLTGGENDDDFKSRSKYPHES